MWFEKYFNFFMNFYLRYDLTLLKFIYIHLVQGMERVANF